MSENFVNPKVALLLIDLLSALASAIFLPFSKKLRNLAFFHG
jgi:hypothetical protein